VIVERTSEGTRGKKDRREAATPSSRCAFQSFAKGGERREKDRAQRETEREGAVCVVGVVGSRVGDGGAGGAGKESEK